MDINKLTPSKDKTSSDGPSEESEPYLGIWWTVLMIFLYLVKSLIDPEPYSLIWYIEMYVLSLVVFVTIFTIYKRYAFSRKVKKGLITKRE